MRDTLLMVAATAGEMTPLLSLFPDDRPFCTLVSGVGPAEASFQLCRYLERNGSVGAVFVFGAAGAYIGSGPGLLDLCIASSEVFGDLGRGQGAYAIERFDGVSFPVCNGVELDRGLRRRAETFLVAAGWRPHAGCFVTVSCVSNSSARGAVLRDANNGLCENMEGAALARVCQAYKLPCLEIRAVSNMVDDSGRAGWRMDEACERAAQAAAIVAHGLCHADIRRVRD